MTAFFADEIPLDAVRGLRPRAWICSGAGFSREELKAFVFRAGATLAKEAVTTPADLAMRILLASDALEEGVVPVVLRPLSRQEVLRELFQAPATRDVIRDAFPELQRLKRQRGFFKKLDRALQGGRMAFAHWDEAAVYSARLEASYGENPLRRELEQFRRLYETRIQAEGWIDEPLLFELAGAVLSRAGWPERLRKPEEILHFRGQFAESLERAFWERVAEHVAVREVGPLRAEFGDGTPEWKWERWHTYDDAAEGLAADIAARGEFERELILIPDQPEIRRSLLRALRDARVPLADPRDPTRIRWDEAVKTAMLPLRAVASGYSRKEVLSWLKAYAGAGEPLAAWEKEIAVRGVRKGLESYAGGTLSQDVHSRLVRLERALGGRKSALECAESHLAILRDWAAGRPERVWVHAFFEKLWTEFCSDLQRLRRAHRKGHALHWLEQLGERLEQIKPPVEPVRPARGVEIFRLSQAPVFGSADVGRRLWIFGMQAEWLSGDGVGDYWFSEREREVLSAEFAVRSAPQVREERLGALRAWIAAAAHECGEARVMDAQYDWNGKERESILPDLRELPGFPLGEPEERGASGRWLPSYGALRPVPPQRVELKQDEARLSKPVEATQLDRYSRCGFQSVAADRWRLRDLREPESELWPDVKGNILHRAVELLLLSRKEGAFTLTAGEALERAWEETRAIGLVHSPRIESYVRSRLLMVLEAFLEKEREYLERSGAEVFELEPEGLALDFGAGLGEVRGRPDRIDSYRDGLFVIDYKTSSSQPSGKDMIEAGYRLQLPFYALATQARHGKPVYGVQFVELTRKGTRSKGVFLKRFNGKKEGCLTNSRAYTSVFDVEDPAELWSRAREQVEATLAGIRSGVFEARPKKETECRSCAYMDLCGKRRKLAEDEEVGADASLVLAE